MDGTLVGGASFDARGFSIPVEPGTYRLTAKSGDASCRDQTVTVTADRYETVTIRCDIRWKGCRLGLGLRAWPPRSAR